MVKCEVKGTPRVSLVVSEGSIVYVDERQYELARKWLVPIVDEEHVTTEETVIVEEPVMAEELAQEVKQSRSKKKTD